MITLDRPAPGLVVAQPKRGFRYGAEAFWLVGFALEYARPELALDLGTGSGILALLLAGQGVRATGIDVRHEWQALWQQTLAQSQVAGTVTLDLGDVSELPVGDWPLVISNPPFFRAGAGPVSPDPWKAAARTEGRATISDFVRVGLRQLSPIGQLCMVFPLDRLDEVRQAAAQGAAHVESAVQVGTRRVLVRIVPGAGQDAHLRAVPDDGDECRRWYALAGAQIAEPPTPE